MASWKGRGGIVRVKESTCLSAQLWRHPFKSGLLSEISSLISQLRSLVATMHKSPVLGYCVMHPSSSLGHLVSGQRCQQ